MTSTAGRLLAVSLLASLFALAWLAGETDGKDAPNPAALTNSIGMKLVLIPAGEFLMGSHETAEDLDRAFPAYNFKSKADLCDDEQQHRVRITKAFYLGAHEVTAGQFKQFVKDTGYKTEAEKDGTGGWGVNAKTGKFEGRKPEYSWRNPGFPQTDDHPVVNVTWNDAVACCKWLSGKESKTCRLPTEAEWEYACRAGTKTRYATGDDPETLLRAANIADASAEQQGKLQFPDWNKFALKGRDGHVFTAPVGRFKPNAFGLYDMHGNAWEWCGDWWSQDYYVKSPLNDPKGPDTGTRRIRRGGAWHTFPLWVRSSFRNYNRPDTRYLNLGFRIVQEK